MFISTTNDIIINCRITGLKVTQNQHGTVVYSPEKPKRQDLVGGKMIWREAQKYKEHPMPHQRYSLAHDAPTKPDGTPTGAAGAAQFEADVQALLVQLD